MSNNPMQPKELAVKTMATILATHGYDRMVVVLQRDGDDGNTQISVCGLGARNRMIAEELREQIAIVALGWEKSEEASALNKMIGEAKSEMATGPENDPEYGNRLIIPTIGMKKERDRKPS